MEVHDNKLDISRLKQIDVGEGEIKHVVGKSKSDSRIPKILNFCRACNTEIKDHLEYCSQECAFSIRRKADWSSIDIRKELENKSMSKLARELGVSDKTIRKYKIKQELVSQTGQGPKGDLIAT